MERPTVSKATADSVLGEFFNRLEGFRDGLSVPVHPLITGILLPSRADCVLDKARAWAKIMDLFTCYQALFLPPLRLW
jgi:hypothetical protein